VALSVVSQGPTTVAVDAEGAAVRDAIIWMDTRAASELRELEAELGVASWGLGPLPHERWISRHEPSVTAAARWYLTPSDWLALRLTGHAHTATPPGSGAGARDLVLRAGGDPTRHPPAIEWGTPIGVLLPGPAGALGIEPGAVVVAGGNDALASFFGAGMRRPGDAIDTGGTSGGFAVYWDAGIDVPGAYWAPAALPGLWLYGGAMSATGKSLEWLATILSRGPTDIEGLLAEAEAVPPGADGLVFLPYLAGERSPIWDPAARGVFAGLTLAHGRGHLVRAVLEGAAFALRHVAAPIVEAGIRVDAMCVSGGTARSELWNRIKADVTGFPVAVPEVCETALMGAAILAATGAGRHPDLLSAMEAMCRSIRVLEPDPALADRYADLSAVYHGLYPATAPLVHRLGRLAT
jgi:xylulokinase